MNINHAISYLLVSLLQKVDEYYTYTKMYLSFSRAQRTFILIHFQQHQNCNMSVIFKLARCRPALQIEKEKADRTRTREKEDRITHSTHDRLCKTVNSNI